MVSTWLWVRDRCVQRKKDTKKKREINKKNFSQTSTAPAVYRIGLQLCDTKFAFGVSVFCQQTRWVMIQYQRGTNKPGPPVQTSVCCGESALSSASIHEKYHKRRLQFMLLQEDEELISPLMLQDTLWINVMRHIWELRIKDANSYFIQTFQLVDCAV